VSRLSIVRAAQRLAPAAWAVAWLLAAAASASAAPPDPGRLFFTPSQRAQLEAARIRSAAPASTGTQAAGGDAPPAQRYDGVVIRSDGRTTRWIDGKPQPDGNIAPGLKPGQVRSGGKVYESYQVLPPAAPPTKEPKP
jgi:hypothetical protein